MDSVVNRAQAYLPEPRLSEVPLAPPRSALNSRRERPAVTGEDILSVRDAAQLLGIPIRTAYRLAGRDELPGARRLGRTVIVVRPVLERWLLNGSTRDAH